MNELAIADLNKLINNQFVVYELGIEKYALKINDTYEIIKMQKITYVPNSKSFLEGIINLRGKVVPVVNMHKRIKMGNYSTTDFTRIMVIKSREEMVGIIVDKVEDVVKFSDIQPPPDIVAGLDSTYFEGIGFTDEGLVSILKIDKVLYEQ